MHKCLRCGTIYEDGDRSILKGCKCGSVFFMYFKTTKDLKRMESMDRKLKKKKTTLEKELRKKIRARKRFDIETVKEPKEGVYKINIQALMKKKPLIIFQKKRAYLIHLPSVFERIKR